MLKIDRLNVSLPGALAERAESISRLVGDALGDTPVREAGRMDRLIAPPVSVDAAWTDRRIAVSIARAIHGSISGVGGSR